MSKAISINGKGKSAAAIAGEYIKYISEENFNLTIDDICSYIGCTYTYFLTNFRNNIEHIYINIPARKMLKDIYESYDLGNVDYSLIRKKILYSRTDFESFISGYLRAEVRYKAFFFQDFEGNSRFNDLIALHGEDKALYLLKEASLRLFGHPSEPLITYIGKTESTLPEKLYRLEDVKTALGYRYNNQVYRHISSYGITKYKLNNLVRYDIRDFEKGRVLVNYEKYVDYENTTEIISEILERASVL